MTCAKVQEHIYLADHRQPLPADVDAHLRECLGCRSELSAWQAAQAALDGLGLDGPEPVLPPSFTESVMASIAAAPAPGGLPAVRVVSGPPAVLVAAAVILLVAAVAAFGTLLLDPGAIGQWLRSIGAGVAWATRILAQVGLLLYWVTVAVLKLVEAAPALVAVVPVAGVLCGRLLFRGRITAGPQPG